MGEASWWGAGAGAGGGARLHRVGRLEGRSVGHGRHLERGSLLLERRGVEGRRLERCPAARAPHVSAAARCPLLFPWLGRPRSGDTPDVSSLGMSKEGASKEGVSGASAFGLSSLGKSSLGASNLGIAGALKPDVSSLGASNLGTEKDGALWLKRRGTGQVRRARRTWVLGWGWPCGGAEAACLEPRQVGRAERGHLERRRLLLLVGERVRQRCRRRAGRRRRRLLRSWQRGRRWPILPTSERRNEAQAEMRGRRS